MKDLHMTSRTSTPSLGAQVLAAFPFLGKIALQKISGKTPGSPRHPRPCVLRKGVSQGILQKDCSLGARFFKWQHKGNKTRSCERTMALLDRRRTNAQQLTCNIDLSCSCSYHFFSFVLIGLKPFVLKEKVPGEKS